VLVAQSLLQQKRPQEAVDFCLEAGKKMPPAAVATVLAQILSTEDSNPALDRKARPLITAALDADRGNVDLLMSVAVERVTRNDLDEAANLFKRVIQMQPNHTLALNNLATLYAEQPAHLVEAQEYVERAMKIAGRNPALLDTFGTILLRAEKYDEAVVALEESVAGSASDPRYYFHLAAAYDSAGQVDQAREALETALEMGLDDAILTEGDRQLLVSLKSELVAASQQN
jgi:Tfp pilus assembly protein PilF